MRALALALLITPTVAFAETSLLAPGAAPEKVAGDLKFGEGPAWNAKGGFLLFEDGPANRMMKLGPDGKVSVFREPSGRSNGLAWDAQGRLVACEGNGDGGRRVSRTEKDGKVVGLADKYEGKKLNSPNDITIDGKGRIYFTDPRYSHRENLELDKEAVYRIDPDGKLTRIIDSLTRPNGILVTRDGKTLYVADNASPGGVVTLVAFDLDAKGNAKNGRVIYDFQSGRGIDGMALDSEGRIWATAGTKEKAGVYVFQPDAKRTKATLVTVVKTPEDPTNCTFGGKDRKTLYVTGISSLYRIQTAVTGQASPPGK
ncbi:MAG TPA: SMP-30/gluconolactonase/LRE family protein [Polyangia bacterium]|nr:SMP-30/gluconolactonase/LRE family protein [Polyangia bacterium]